MTSFPVFIVGTGRCGTAMLVRIISRATSIAIPAESHFIPVFYRRLEEYGDLKKGHNLLRLLKDIGRHPFVRDWNMKFIPEELVGKVVNPTFSGLLEAIYSEYARQHGKTRWGDKTPGYGWYMREIIDDIFPNAKFIHIIRDGRDCALSVIKTTWGPKNVYKAARWWKKSMLNILKQKGQIDPAQYLEVCYERLLQNPESEIKRIFEFLGESVDEKIIKGLPIKSDNFDKWRKGMTPCQVELFERIAGDVLAEHGYPVRLNPEQRKEPGSIKTLYYLADNRVKSVKNVYYDIKRKIYGTMAIEHRK